MTRLSQKTIIQREFSENNHLAADFNNNEITATIANKGYQVIHEKAYFCPCKSKSGLAHLSTCQNCRGTGWFFANPTKTYMTITSIQLDGKLKEAALREWGNLDLGTVKITAVNGDKFSYMDRITVLDATSEHNEIIYPSLSDDELSMFAMTQYDIVSVNFLGLFVDVESKLAKLEEPIDYSFIDNIVTLTNAELENPQLTIRYVHKPSFYITDILRESMTSTVGQSRNTISMPIHALAKRAHLIKDIENLDGDRILDNSWLPSTCQVEELTNFQRQLRYTPVSVLWDFLTDNQKTELEALLEI